MKDLDKLKSVHFFKERLSFPVVTYVFSDWDEVQITYLSRMIKGGGMSTLNICNWCQNHGIKYQVIFPKKIWKLIIVDPKRLRCYMYLKKHKVSSIKM